MTTNSRYANRAYLVQELRKAWRRLKQVQREGDSALDACCLYYGQDWKWHTKKSHFGLLRLHVLFYLRLLKDLRDGTRTRFFSPF